VAVVIQRPQALTDLAEIWAYIADDSPDNADAFAEMINQNLQTLARQPGMGRARPELAKDLRSR
jgi:toxin ParE1/3/4